MPKRKISEVWKWFGRSKDKKFAKCNQCGKEYQTSGNTSNLFDHIKRIHGELLKDKDNITEESEDSNHAISIPSSSSSTRSIPEYFSRQNSYDKDSLRKKDLDKALVYMIATDFQPFQIVEDEGFSRFVKLLDPKYNLPSKRTLKNSFLVNYFTEVELSLKSKLQQTEFVSITSDLWTSRIGDSYITVTCHFFDNEYIYRSAVLSTNHLTLSHTAENLASALDDVLSHWEIKQKVVCIVTDNAANIIKACQSDVLRIRNQPCLAHTLNLIIQTALKQEDFSTIFKKCKDIVTHLKHSNIATENLRKEQREMNKPELKLIQEVPTRWNSSFFMIQRLLKVHGPLTVALSKTTKAPPSLTADDISVLEEVVELLQPFEESTRKLSGDNYITVSLIIPIVFDIYTKLSEMQVKLKTEVGKKILNCLVDGVKLRLFLYEERTVCRMATILDPRLKKEAFRSAANCKAAVSMLQSELPNHVIYSKEPDNQVLINEDVASGGYSNASIDTAHFQFGFMKKRLEEKQRSKTVDTIILLRQYLERPNTNSEPLLFWKVNGHEFAPLQRCALKYLCVPATSVSSERIFSKAGQIVSNRRSNIKPKNVNMLVFQNQNKWLIE